MRWRTKPFHLTFTTYSVLSEDSLLSSAVVEGLLICHVNEISQWLKESCSPTWHRFPAESCCYGFLDVFWGAELKIDHSQRWMVAQPAVKRDADREEGAVVSTLLDGLLDDGWLCDEHLLYKTKSLHLHSWIDESMLHFYQNKAKLRALRDGWFNRTHGFGCERSLMSGR